MPRNRLNRYLVNRYYDPTTDQFLAVDPLVGLTGQAFSYANNDPVNVSDPSGLSGDAQADEQYDVQHSCKGRSAHAQGCGQHWYQPPCSLLGGVARSGIHVAASAYNSGTRVYEHYLAALEVAHYQYDWGLDLGEVLAEAESGLAGAASNPEDEQVAIIVILIALG